MAAGGYAWWYVDALSEDGQFGLAVIALIGSVFSPYYAWSGRLAPYEHCAVNVSLYSPRRKWWTMTERGAASVDVDRYALQIGPSRLDWNGDGLTISMDEITTPFRQRVCGEVRLVPRSMCDRTFSLHPQSSHLWRPVAPRADVEVQLRHPKLAWRGTGYLDCNSGSEPLENGFVNWNWSRAHTGSDTVLFYDSHFRSGGSGALALRIDGQGQVTTEPTPVARLPRSMWGLSRTTRAAGGCATVLRTLEDGPFYARSMLSTTLNDGPAIAVHESLSLDRFSTRWVKALLPYRMPRSTS